MTNARLPDALRLSGLQFSGQIAHEREGLPLTPLANCVADTQGGIGYLIQQALNNRLARHGEKKAVTVVTRRKSSPTCGPLPWVSTMS